ncbi:bifunctional peptidase and [Trichonephila clavata]|uniref:Bifunctional peptidase and n=1 Tax=Trichonephila clavata TaxID=2740835 RepID=A0A8X6GT52_TRICU|nr:bifunctional peptidase and [Trichonephila clavata]
MAEKDKKRKSFVNCMKDFTDEYCDLLPIDVPILDKAPTSLEFLRNYVSSNVPFVLKNGIKQWPAYRKWNDSYLREQLHNNMCTVAVTPNGYADAILEDRFMLPEERTISFNEFLDEMNCPVHDRVLYLQKQNNCLVDEFSCLMKDVYSHVPWATEALGDLPEAANFWMGDSRAVTSLHKDHYENIYCVVRGSKEFILYPPILAAWVPYKTFRKSQYCWEDGKCKIKDLDDEVKWVPFDPKLDNDKKFPMVSQLKKYHIILEAGDMLYLPALWFHHVEQSHSCIAVNYWYEMKYDMKYAFFRLMDEFGQSENCFD